jgi:hypothetical protein
VALNDYLCTHPKLRNEIKDRMGVVQGIEEPEAQLLSMEGDCCNDSDVPLHLVIQETLGITAVSADPEEAGLPAHCVMQVRQDEDGNLVAGSESENVWAYNNGELWGDKAPELDNAE